jgi:type II secretory ATPase GspE/PulE/Tfp pilus assembly ATPase PilB-like protein
MTDNLKSEYFISSSIISEKELDNAWLPGKKNGEENEETSLSKYFKLPFLKYDDFTYSNVEEKLFFKVETHFMQDNLWVPINQDKKVLIIAINNPFDIRKTDEIKNIFYEYDVQFYAAFKKDIIYFIDAFIEKNQNSHIDKKIDGKKNSAGEKKEFLDSEDISIINMVNDVITEAHEKRASDIHIEPYPGKKDMNIRLRIDGTCRLYKEIGYTYKDAFISRLKVMAELDIAERRKPQDGKIKFKNFGKKDIEIRIATIPTHSDIEDITLRILPSGKPTSLDKMHFSKENYENFIKSIEKPHGIIIVCGPTGSGKTFTLHSALKHLNKPDIKIWTAEDPVEITQDGLRQVQVNPKIGLNFASAMRAFLRADPDVIMLGEMRDKETAKIGIQASLTGHLVFSTLHTNSAPESVARLLDMGMDSFNFADAIICVISQRLVLTLCNSCKKAFHPSEGEYLKLVREFGKKEFKRLNITYSDELVLYKPSGCPECDNTGYKGRIAIHELLTGTDDIKRLIQNKAGTEKIKKQAVKDGMLTLKQDGIRKVFEGFCDFREIAKVCI